MRIFVTGATGFLGSTIVSELLSSGHRVLGLARSDSSAQALVAAGAEVHRGELGDEKCLRAAVEAADAVIHAGFNHDFSKFAQNCEMDRRAIEVMGNVLRGSDRPFIVTAGLPLATGRQVTENDVAPSTSGDSPRRSEQAALALAEQGVLVSVIRVSQIHDQTKHGLATYLIALAREKGISAYVGSGLNVWPAVHRNDAAALYRLALEKGEAGARYHAVSEAGIPLREIAEAIGAGLKIPVASISPEEANSHFGWLAFLAGADTPASSTLTQQRLGWHPTKNPAFLDDLKSSVEFKPID